MHCPMEGCCLLAQNGSLTLEYTLDKHRACFELARELGAEYVVIHTNSLAPKYEKDILLQKARLPERMAMISDTAKEYGLHIAVENVGFGYNKSLVADMTEFISLSENRSLEFLIDTGHAHANGWDIPMLLLPQLTIEFSACPADEIRRQKTLKYPHIPAVFFLGFRQQFCAYIFIS